jgi:hypothetical protein
MAQKWAYLQRKCRKMNRRITEYGVKGKYAIRDKKKIKKTLQGA